MNNHFCVKINFITILLVLCISNIYSQVDEKRDSNKRIEINTIGDDDDDDAPLIFVDQMPKFPGGMDSLVSFLKRNLVYPVNALKNNISGKTVVKFIVDKKGKIGKISVVRGFDNDCDAEAVRVVSIMPDCR